MFSRELCICNSVIGIRPALRNSPHVVCLVVPSCKEVALLAPDPKPSLWRKLRVLCTVSGGLAGAHIQTNFSLVFVEFCQVLASIEKTTDLEISRKMCEQKSGKK